MRGEVRRRPAAPRASRAACGRDAPRPARFSKALGLIVPLAVHGRRRGACGVLRAARICSGNPAQQQAGANKQAAETALAAGAAAGARDRPSSGCAVDPRALWTRKPWSASANFTHCSPHVWSESMALQPQQRPCMRDGQKAEGQRRSARQRGVRSHNSPRDVRQQSGGWHEHGERHSQAKR